MSEEAAQIRLRRQAGARVGAAAGHTHGGTNSVTGYIGNRDCNAPIRQLLPVEIVSTCLIGRLVPACDIKTVDSRRRFRKKPLLNRTGNAEVTLHPSPILRLTQSLKNMPTDLTSHNSRSEPSEEQKSRIRERCAVNKQILTR